MVTTASPIVVVVTDGAVVVETPVDDTVVVDRGEPDVLVVAAEVLVSTTVVGPDGVLVDSPPAPAPSATTATTSTARPVPPAIQVRDGTLRNWSTAATTEG